MMIDLEINNASIAEIAESFDRIAKDLLSRKALYVNSIEFRFTEIEFYYFLKETHEDNTVHKHMRGAGEWRFHSQGLDITFKGNAETDGGILIRGVKVNNDYVNGPRRVLVKIFECFNKVEDINTLVVRDINEDPVRIIKTFRQLPKVENPPLYYSNYYRYFSLENLDDYKPQSVKEIILKNSKAL